MVSSFHLSIFPTKQKHKNPLILDGSSPTGGLSPKIPYKSPHKSLPLLGLKESSAAEVVKKDLASGAPNNLAVLKTEKDPEK